MSRQSTSEFKTLAFSRCLRDLACKIAKTPAAVYSKKDCLSAGESVCEEDTQRYQSIIGSLMCDMIGTRPDIVLSGLLGPGVHGDGTGLLLASLGSTLCQQPQGGVDHVVVRAWSWKGSSAYLLR